MTLWLDKTGTILHCSRFLLALRLFNKKCSRRRIFVRNFYQKKYLLEMSQPPRYCKGKVKNTRQKKGVAGNTKSAISNKNLCTCVLFTKLDMMSMGTGNTIVLLFSAEMLFKVCRYRSCRYHICNDNEKEWPDLLQSIWTNLHHHYHEKSSQQWSLIG